ncbi:MAG: alpha/beta hydrolase family protein [Pyrinomonadaceae bacterium]
MKNLFLYALVFLSIFTPSAFGQDNSNLEGNWSGAIEVSGIKLRLVLKIVKTGDAYMAKLDSIDQGAKDLPIDSITRKDKTITFSAAKFGMSYEGTLNEKADEINGILKQGAGTLPLNFKRAAEEIRVAKRPQDPQKPYPYNEEEVVYKNVKDAVKLAGTLTLPRGDGKFPAVVLITGSGSQDRDETILGHRPFLVLADYLTRRGIAVLRVDDRGIGGSDLGSLLATTENYVGDVLAGVEYLKSRKEINSNQIGLIGHSEGGIIAPMAAVRSKDVAFIVMLAGSGQRGDDVILTQIALINKASGENSETIARAMDLQKSLFAIIESEPDDKLAEQKISEMLIKRKGKMNEQELKAFAPVEADIKAQMPLLLSPWYRWFLAYNPRPTLEKVKIPVLALNGENDVQVAPKENLALISAALKAGGNKDYTVKSFPKLNHLFQTSQTGLPNEYGEIAETISPEVLETIADWILKHTAVK